MEKETLEKLADYAANFLSNMAVAGFALAIFKEDDAVMTCLIAIVAFIWGGLACILKKG